MAGFGEDRIHQLLISYGCRTEPVTEVKPDQGGELKKRLRETWPELFAQEISSARLPVLPAGRPLLGFEQSFYMKDGLATVGTLMVFPETFTLNVPRKLGGSTIRLCREDLWLKERATNRRAQQALMHVYDVLSVAPHRAGKIYEIVLAPVAPEESKVLFQNLCPSIKEDATEYAINATFLRTVEDVQYNVVLQLTANRLQPMVAVKVDVNNRDLERSLDPQNVVRVFEIADSLMPKWLFSLLGGETQ